FYTADLHFDHALVSGLRGFASPAEHDDAVCARWRAAVDDRDIVWVLGDLAVTHNPSRLAAVLDRIGELPGVKHLILGNHDTAHPRFRDAHRHQRTYLQVFESVQSMARRKVNGIEVMLSHYPYAGDHTESDRDNQYRLRDEGRWLMHGHTHSPVRWTGPRQVHVGLDAWSLSPVPESEIARIIAQSSEPARSPSSTAGSGTDNPATEEPGCSARS
ncbi:MAG TPA: metallophosphoesterase family protein, partial [Nakamurella sp.]